MIAKKASISSTLVWIVGTLIIVFILLIYVGVITTLFAKKKISLEGEKYHLEITKDRLDRYFDRKNLMAILYDRVHIQGKEKTLKEAVDEELREYMKLTSRYPNFGNFIERYYTGVYREAGLNQISIEKIKYDGYDYMKVLELREAEQKELFPVLRKAIKKYCSNFTLIIPQGVITENPTEKRLTAQEITEKFDETNYPGWTTPVEYNWVRNFTKFTIKFRMLRKCAV